MHTIRIPEDRSDVKMQWGGNRAKLWCYKQFGYMSKDTWECYWAGDHTVFVFEQAKDATFFSLRWGV